MPIESIPLTQVLGERDKPVKIEESWSRDVPNALGANVPSIPEIDRSINSIKAAVEATHKLREGRMKEANSKPGPIVPLKVIGPLHHHFFVLKGKKLELIGSKEMDASKFAKDVSGRFFREWLKKSFPDRRDYDDIVSFDDNMTLKDMVDLLGVCE